MRVLKRVIDGERDGLRFECPGCGESHVVNVTPGPGACWGWNGDMDRPTLTPSVLVRAGHYVPGWEGEDCWCNYNVEHPDDPAPFVCYICHSFVTEGRIQFLSDCTHALAGQTVDLPEIASCEA